MTERYSAYLGRPVFWFQFQATNDLVFLTIVPILSLSACVRACVCVCVCACVCEREGEREGEAEKDLLSTRVCHTS